MWYSGAYWILGHCIWNYHKEGREECCVLQFSWKISMVIIWRGEFVENVQWKKSVIRYWSWDFVGYSYWYDGRKAKAVLDVVFLGKLCTLSVMKPSEIRAGSTYLSWMVVFDCNSVPERRIIYFHKRANMYVVSTRKNYY